MSLCIPQAIQIESVTREKRRGPKMEIACEEGCFGQNHIFLVLAKEKERRRAKNEPQ